MHHDQGGLMPGMQRWFDVGRAIGVIRQINRIKDKNHTISIAAQKTFDKNPTPFHDETRSQLKIEGNFLKLIKGNDEKTTANIMLVMED